MQTNEFRKATDFLTEDCEIYWPQSNELIIGRDNFIKINENYPSDGLWEFKINSIICEVNEVVTDVSVTNGKLKARAITFHTVRSQLIHRQKEFWPDNFSAPEWRKLWVKV